MHDSVHTPAELGCTDLHGENDEIDANELSAFGATGCNDNKKGAVHEEPHHVVPRGFEPLLPG